jgi:hypothetical protein
LLGDAREIGDEGPLELDNDSLLLVETGLELDGARPGEDDTAEPFMAPRLDADLLRRHGRGGEQKENGGGGERPQETGSAAPELIHQSKLASKASMSAWLFTAALGGTGSAATGAAE